MNRKRAEDIAAQWITAALKDSDLSIGINVEAAVTEFYALVQALLDDAPLEDE